MFSEYQHRYSPHIGGIKDTQAEYAKEVLDDMNSAKMLIEYAIAAQKMGYPHIAGFFLEAAKGGCDHIRSSIIDKSSQK